MVERGLTPTRISLSRNLWDMIAPTLEVPRETGEQDYLEILQKIEMI